MQLRFSFSKQILGHFKHSSNGRARFVIGFVAAILILATATVAAFRSKRPSTVNKAPVASSSQQMAPAQSPANRIAEVLPIQLKAGGFVPREITRPKGDYFFSVQNVSGQQEILLSLEREQGERTHEVNLSKQKRSWRQLVHLAPGNYLITAANHPTWVCRISITAQ